MNGGSNTYRHTIRANGRVIMIREATTGGHTHKYLHRDHLGSVTAITDESTGTVQERLSYDAWGMRRNATSWVAGSITATDHRGYTGHEHLDDIGVIHMNGRIYSPSLGRMLSPDPVTQAPDNGQNYDRYTYAFNNPLKYSDPSGYCAKLEGTCRTHSIPRYQSDQGGGGKGNSGDYDIGNRLRDKEFQSSEGTLTLGGLPPELTDGDIDDVANPQILNTTADAIAHYFQGNGAPAELSESVKGQIMNHPEILAQIERNKNGTGAPPNRIDLNLEGSWETYHLGDTKVTYVETCSNGSCTTTFTAPILDVTGAPDCFCDPFEGAELFGTPYELPYGTPFTYVPFTWSVSYPDPGVAN